MFAGTARHRPIARSYPPTRMGPTRSACTRFSLATCILVCACSPLYGPVREIKEATVPPGDTAPVLEEPVREAQSLRFSWEFDSHLEPPAYLEWITTRLINRGFAMQQRDAMSIGMTRLDGGDAYRLRIEVTGRSPTHVRVSLLASPN
jgi:hypothetical protein